MKKIKFKWPAKGKFLGLGRKIFSWLPFFVACGFTLFAAVFFIVPAEDVEASSTTNGKLYEVRIQLPCPFSVTYNGSSTNGSSTNGSSKIETAQIRKGENTNGETIICYESTFEGYVPLNEDGQTYPNSYPWKFTINLDRNAGSVISFEKDVAFFCCQYGCDGHPNMAVQFASINNMSFFNIACYLHDGSWREGYSANANYCIYNKAAGTIEFSYEFQPTAYANKFFCFLDSTRGVCSGTSSSPAWSGQVDFYDSVKKYYYDCSITCNEPNALNYFRWGELDTNSYGVTKYYEPGENGSIDAKFWVNSNKNFKPSKEGAKLFVKPGYTLEGAEIEVTYNDSSSSSSSSDPPPSPFEVYEHYILFNDNFDLNDTKIYIDGAKHIDIPVKCYVDTRAVKGTTYFEADYTPVNKFPFGLLTDSTIPIGLLIDSTIPSKFTYNSEYIFNMSKIGTDLSCPISRSGLSLNLYDGDVTSSECSNISSDLVDIGEKDNSLYFQLKCKDADIQTLQGTDYLTVESVKQAYVDEYDRGKYKDDISKNGCISVVISGLTFKFHDLNVSSKENIKSISCKLFTVDENANWKQGVESCDLKVKNAKLIPVKHAFDFYINFDDGCHYDIETLGYITEFAYTCGSGEKINDILSITDASNAAVNYNFIFYDGYLHISIPENVITSDITVTIKQGPEKFADCLNSFSFENEGVKNGVSVHSMRVLGLLDSIDVDNYISVSVSDDEIDYEIVRNSKAHYYAVKLKEVGSNTGYTFDNFGVQSSQGAEVTILKGEDLEKIGLKDEDHIRYIRVYLDDPAATSHVISFTGIYTILKSVEITLSDGIKDMKADSFVGAINTQFSTESKKWTMNVYYGQYLNFTIAPKEGYYLNRSDILSVTPKDGLYEAKLDELGSDMGILIHNIRDDIKLEVKVQQAPLSITFENVEGFEYHSVGISEGAINSVGEQILATVNVAPSSDYYFAVKANNGYDLTTVVVKNYDSDLNSISGPNSDYKYYKLEKIQQHAKISGTIDKIKYNIKFNKSAHGTLPGSEESEAVITYTQDGEKISSLKIVHGESISFEVGLEDRFSSSNIKVYSTWEDGSKEEIFVSGDIYTLSNIMHDCEIYVEGIELNRYVINFAQNDKVQYELDGKLKASGAVSVKHGDDYTFKLIPKKGYQITDKTIVNQKTVEGTTSLKSTSAGSYTISNMLQDCTITVENAEDIIYKISFKNQGGVTYRNRDGDVITESLSIKYGENFEFAVELDDAYDDSIQGMKPVANDDKSINSRVNKLAEGKYLISNVIEDINLEVLNVRKNRYTVSLVKMEGVDFHNSNGKVITGPNEVEHGESLNFKVYVYPAYDGSKLKVMLGDNPLAAQTAGDYLVEGVTENKTVTVIGVEESLVTRLINTINNLPNPISDLDDVDKVIEASKMYQLIPADQRHLVTNISVLNGLQEQSKSFHHVNNGITVDGVSWRIKLVAVPISSSTEACARIYKKLDSEYVLSLYDVYFWDTVNEVRYTPAKEQTISLTLPKPDLKYFENATGVCGDAKGDVNFLSLSFSGDSVHLNTNSPGYIGVIADRTSTPGRSSLLDAADANWETLTNALSSFGIGSPKEDASQGTSIFNDIENDSDANDIIQEGTGNISEKYKSRNNKVTAQGSAIRLVLVLMIVILVAVIVWVIVKKRKERKEMDN